MEQRRRLARGVQRCRLHEWLTCGAARPLHKRVHKLKRETRLCSFVGSLSQWRRASRSHQLALCRQYREPNPRGTLLRLRHRCHRLDPPQHDLLPQLCARKHHNPRRLASNVGLPARLLDAERRPARRRFVRLQQALRRGSLRERVEPHHLRLQRPLLARAFLPRGIRPPTEVPRRDPHAQQAGGERFGLLPLRPRPIPARERPGGVLALRCGFLLPRRGQRRLRSLPKGRLLRGRGRRFSPCLAGLSRGQLQPEQRLQLERGVRVVPQLALQNLDLTICAKRYISVPSRGSCDPAEWTGAHSRWRGVPPSTQRGRSCLCASCGCTFVARRR